ncbi:GNAT family N-acetyltransferase [Hyphomonas sp.]|uniref:GNAT family N-acetyltransferase n=1 Tax=Hyphomonas sp. TaxID=87 RepID=UPI003D292D5D
MIQPMDIRIRPEEPIDQRAIYNVTKQAFATMPFAAGDEQRLINVLRDEGALSLSLVAEQRGKVVGHLALSPVTHESGEAGWYGLGPISVDPALQKKGIGGQLIAEAKAWMTARKARGCILVGDPNYYTRHGFLPAPAQTPEKEPPEYFMVLQLAGTAPVGRFSFHPAFHD